MTDLIEKINDLETRLCFQEDTIEQLSDQLYSQQQRLDLLEQALQKTYQQLQQISAGQDTEIVDAPPPHY